MVLRVQHISVRLTFCNHSCSTFCHRQWVIEQLKEINKVKIKRFILMSDSNGSK